MTKIEAAAAPQPKEDPKREAPAPARWKEETAELSVASDGDDRWAHMPCTD